jgi:hypothetical protein
MNIETPMRRPVGVTAIACLLIVWNGFMMIGTLPQDLYYHNMPFLAAAVTRLFSFWLLFIILGVNMLRRKNWARITYLVAAPINLGINLVLGTLRLGFVNLADRIPSLVVTVLFVVLLLRPSAKAWFCGAPLPPPTDVPARTRPIWFAPACAVGSVIAAVLALLWLANHFLRVAGPGDERSQGIIEYYMSK